MKNSQVGRKPNKHSPSIFEKKNVYSIYYKIFTLYIISSDIVYRVILFSNLDGEYDIVYRVNIFFSNLDG